jgi:copper chaperone NosL
MITQIPNHQLPTPRDLFWSWGFGSWKLGVGSLSLALLVACSAKPSGPPDIVVDRTACSHCGMLISEPLYAAAFQVQGAEPRVFDDIGCLRKAAGSQGGAVTFWFHDADTREWITGGTAVFVSARDIHTPMGGGVIAFQHRAAADRAAGTHRGFVIDSIAGLLSVKGES